MKKLLPFLVLISSSACPMQQFSPLVLEAGSKTLYKVSEAAKACSDLISVEILLKCQEKLFNLMLQEDYYGVRAVIKKSNADLVNMQWPQHLQVDLLPDKYEENPIHLAVMVYQEAKDKRSSLKILKFLLRQKPIIQILTRAKKQMERWEDIGPKDPALVAINRAILKNKFTKQLF